MKIDVALRIDSQAESKSILIQEISESLKSFFAQREYGISLKEILITCICVNVPEGYEHLFEIKKPKYIENKTLDNIYTGETLILEKILMYDVKFSTKEYDDFIDSKDFESRNIFKRKLIDSLIFLDKLPKKIKDFPKEKFRSDFANFLEAI